MLWLHPLCAAAYEAAWEGGWPSARRREGARRAAGGGGGVLIGKQARELQPYYWGHVNDAICGGFALVVWNGLCFVAVAVAAHLKAGLAVAGYIAYAQCAAPPQ